MCVRSASEGIETWRSLQELNQNGLIFVNVGAWTCSPTLSEFRALPSFATEEFDHQIGWAGSMSFLNIRVLVDYDPEGGKARDSHRLATPPNPV